MSEEVDSVSVVCEGGVGDNAEDVELVGERAFAEDELRGVGAVETVDAVCAADAVLEGGARAGGRTGVRGRSSGT